jgi:hypothetical protein
MEPRSSDQYWDGFWKLSPEERKRKIQGANPGQKIEYERMIRQQQEAVQRIIIYGWEGGEILRSASGGVRCGQFAHRPRKGIIE